MTRGRAAMGSLVALATSCSLFTSLDGLSGGATAQTGTDSGDDGGGVITPPDARDASVDVDVSTPAKPRAWRQIMVAGPPAVHSARMVFDEKRKKVVLYGGAAGGTMASDTWEWDGAAWAKTLAVTNPGARSAPGLAYDSARGLTMIFAGTNGTSDPWEFDGTTWKSSGSSPSSPDVRYGSAMTYDRARNVLVVFGGVRAAAPNPPNGETWEWSTLTGFVKRTPPLSPPARRSNVLVYDSARSRVVTFGGHKTELLADTWEWDGTSWTQRSPPLSPSPRRGACGAFDAGRKVTVVFGGRGETNATGLDDTWTWDGSAWTAGPHGPPGRSSCAMAYDSARDQVVLFGGSPAHVGMTPPTSVNDTWVYE